MEKEEEKYKWWCFRSSCNQVGSEKVAQLLESTIQAPGYPSNVNDNQCLLYPINKIKTNYIQHNFQKIAVSYKGVVEKKKLDLHVSWMGT